VKRRSPPQLRQAGRLVDDVIMIAGTAGMQAGRQSEARIFLDAVVLEVREGRERGGLKIQRIWTIEVGNNKITNEPPNLPTSLRPLVIYMRVQRGIS
jgi:hypothetical protein